MEKFKSNPSKTVLTISMGFLVMYLFAKWNWAIKVSVVIGLIGVFSTYLSQKIEWLWMGLGGLLGLVVPKILLSIIFYFFLFPIASLSKLFTKTDTLMLKNERKTTFNDSKKEFEKADFEKIW